MGRARGRPAKDSAEKREDKIVLKSNGEFEYAGDTEVGLNNSKPVYIYEYEKGGKQFRVILQF